jgi:hypothetical protein
MDKIHVSAVFTCAKRICGGNDSSRLQEPGVQQLLQQLPALAVQVQQQYGARELGNIIWACGYLRLPDVVMMLLPALLQQQVLAQADAWSLSTALHGVEKSGARPSQDLVQQLVSAFMALADAQPSSFSRHGSSVMLLLAKLRMPLTDAVMAAQWQQLLQQLAQDPAAHVLDVHKVLATLLLRFQQHQQQQQSGAGRVQGPLPEPLSTLSDFGDPDTELNQQAPLSQLQQHPSAQLMQQLTAKFVQLLLRAQMT